MADDISSVELQMAIAALRRIARKKSGFLHADKPRYLEGIWTPPETCDCPQCIAISALEQIVDLETQRVRKSA